MCDWASAAVLERRFVDGDVHGAGVGLGRAKLSPVGVVLVRPEACNAGVLECNLVVVVVHIIVKVAREAVEDLVAFAHFGKDVVAIDVVPDVDG
eukprot:6175913-Pleurochrysis_carterae.AAC.3